MSRVELGCVELGSVELSTHLALRTGRAADAAAADAALLNRANERARICTGMAGMQPPLRALV